jgi:argininosuccinate lyase
VSDPALLATDVADDLVGRGMAFREAHGIVGQLVAAAEKLGKPLNQLTSKELKAVSGCFGPETARIFELHRAMAKRNIVGAPGTRAVREQLDKWRRKLRQLGIA